MESRDLFSSTVGGVLRFQGGRGVYAAIWPCPPFFTRLCAAVLHVIMVSVRAP